PRPPVRAVHRRRQLDPQPAAGRPARGLRPAPLNAPSPAANGRNRRSGGDVGLRKESPMSNPHRMADGVDRGPVVNEFEAKQGRRGSQILVVLVTSLALIVIAFGALYVFSARPFTAHNPVDTNSRAPVTQQP